MGVRYPAPRGSHRLTGQRVPDLTLLGDGPGGLYESLRSGQFVLVSRAEIGPAPWPGRVTARIPADATTPTMLVRPDAYIAWADDDPAPAQVTRALTTWCGSPAGDPIRRPDGSRA